MSKRIIAGVDEVGRGPLAGPVVAACVIIPEKSLPWLSSIRDSKKLSSKSRVELSGLIKDHCIWSIAECDVDIIDSINILQATMKAMTDAVKSCSVQPDYVYIDGNRLPQDLPCDGEYVIKGDDKIVEIAAASIIAKVHRDKIMEQYANEFHEYGWQNNSGYGTRKHIEAIQKHGVTIHHRRSFAPVKKALAK